MKIAKLLVALLLTAGALAGCGGGSAPFQCATGTSCGSSSGGSGSGGNTSSPEEMGSTVNAAFAAGVIGTPGLTTGTQLSAGGSTQLTLAFQVTKTGAPATDAITVAFTSKCPAGTATITPATATNTSGSVTATYASAGGCGLTQDTVTATVTSGGTTLTNTTATATIALAQAQANSIVFLSATPSNIGLQGTGQPTSSIVTFQVVTAAGGPVANASVDFSLSTTLGGVQLVGTNPAVTGSDGKASITVQAGTRAQSVVVTATTTTSSGKVAANSNSLTVTTGIPDATRVSLAVGLADSKGAPLTSGLSCPNVEAWNIDGIYVRATMRMKDRFSNPVPDGTPVNFATSGGGITAQCLTATGASESGLCAVDWVSQNPRPPAHNGLGAGRAAVVAVAVGEKHFTDNYGLGYFVGPPSTAAANGADPITPLVMTGGVGNGTKDTSPGDPYLDANENGVYDIGETYYNINNSSTRAVDTANYVGLLCGGPNATVLPTLCNGKANGTTEVGAEAVIVMSSSNAVISTANPGAPIDIRPADPINVPNGTGGLLDFWISDVNGNAMPAGTTIELSGQPSNVTGGTDKITWGCDTTYYGLPTTTNAQTHLPNGMHIQIFLTDSVNSGKSASLTVKVTAPSGSLSGALIPIIY